MISLQNLNSLKLPALLILVIYGIVVRVFGCLEPLWLDELWALDWIRSMPSFSSIFTDYFSENNHFLQSFWLYLVRDHSSAVLLRAFSFLCSFTLLVLLGRRTMAGSTFHAVLLVLVSTSYLFVLYGTEARGYSPLLLFLWLVYDTGENLVQEFSVRRIAVFSIAVLLAALSHLSALTFIAAVLIGLIPRVGFMRATIAGIFPVVLVGVLWFTFISKLAQASGDIGNELLAIINIFSVGFGGPAVGATLQGVFAFIVAPIVAISLLFLVFLSVRKKDEQALFFAAGIFMLPIATWLVYQPGYTYARHFLPALFVAYLCVARRMALVFESQQPQMVRGVIFVLMLFIGGNAANNFTLCVYGRGGYEKIVQLLADDRGAIVSDRPFRHQALLKHYSENLSSGLAVLKGQNDGLPEWVQMKESEAAEPKWFLSIGNPYETPKEVDLAHFELVGVFPSAPLSGWEVQLFKTLPGKNVR